MPNPHKFTDYIPINEQFLGVAVAAATELTTRLSSPHPSPLPQDIQDLRDMAGSIEQFAAKIVWRLRKFADELETVHNNN